MTNLPNLAIYRIWAPVYDLVFRPLTARARRDTVRMLALRPGENLLVPCVGTGLDLPLFPPDVQVTAGDISLEMLQKARLKAAGKPIELVFMDAQNLRFDPACFEAVLFCLALSCVPDARSAFGEAWRVLSPGGRIAIFDKFIPENQALNPLRRLLGWLIRFFGTDPNRRLSEILDGWPGLQVVQNHPSLLGGQYRIVLIEKGPSE